MMTPFTIDVFNKKDWGIRSASPALEPGMGFYFLEKK